ncbi:MAG: ATP-binding protein [Gemmatimonadota bacterium]|nr:ATP-binding protein [Gemmatimonadota bacterium]
MNYAQMNGFAEPDEQPIFIGKDILELLSSSMYINPLSIYREYIQNAVDAIDEAVSAGLLDSPDAGVIEIDLDQLGRRAIIRDNGIGVPNDEFQHRMLSFGGSNKRSTNARGFRGVGRLSGLGYVQQLVFRSRATGDPHVLEAVWDGRFVKQLLLSAEMDTDLYTVVQKAVAINRIDSHNYPVNFFEVQMIKPRRIANDKLMNESEIEAFLAQTCPCHFSPEFEHGLEVDRLLSSYDRAGSSYSIFMNGSDTPICRPYRNSVTYSESKVASLGKLRTFDIRGIDDEISATGWFVHHDYQGAIPVSQGVRGLRARVGNIQIGDDRVFSDVFPEERFCSWTIGEVHVLDPRVIPNGRRDAFEANVHLDNIIMHLRPVVSEIVRECRFSSQRRNRRKAFELRESKVTEKLDIVRQGAISENYAKVVNAEIGSLLMEMQKIAQFESFDDVEKTELKNRYDEVETKVKTCIQYINRSAFDSLSKRHQTLYREVFDLIYDCSANQVAAKRLIDRMLDRISRM